MIIERPADSASQEARTRLTLALATISIIAMQAWLIVTKAVNWDEFWFYSQIHEAAQGVLAKPLQTFHVRLFAWLAHIPADSITRIEIARATMLVCWCTTALAIAATAKRFVSGQAAWLGALAYLSAGYAFLHGAAFRTDPILAALLMMALWLLQSSRLDYRRVCAIALLIATATMLSIKVVLYLPAFAGMAWLCWCEDGRSRAMLVRLLVIAPLSCAIFALFYFAHSSGLTVDPASTSAATIRSSSDKMFSDGLLPQARYLFGQIALAPFLASIIITLPLALFSPALSGPNRVALMGLTLPLLSVLIYRNSFAYYYAFILPPAVVAASWAIERLWLRLGPAALAGIFTFNAAMLAAAEPRDTLPRQQLLLTEIDRMFPEPVAYFDFCAMVGHFPRRIDFLTRWGLERYREAERPRFTEAMAREPVPLLVVNHFVLEAALDGKSIDHGLLPLDATALRENYIQHWGPIWVAGKKLASNRSTREIVIAVPGRYTIEGGPLEIDGKLVRPGSVINLVTGRHVIGPHSAPVTIRWGDHIHRPITPFPAGPLFTDF